MTAWLTGKHPFLLSAMAFLCAELTRIGGWFLVLQKKDLRAGFKQVLAADITFGTHSTGCRWRKWDKAVNNTFLAVGSMVSLR